MTDVFHCYVYFGKGRAHETRELRCPADNAEDAKETVAAQIKQELIDSGETKYYFEVHVFKLTKVVTGSYRLNYG